MKVAGLLICAHLYPPPTGGLTGQAPELYMLSTLVLYHWYRPTRTSQKQRNGV